MSSLLTDAMDLFSYTGPESTAQMAWDTLPIARWYRLREISVFIENIEKMERLAFDRTHSKFLIFGDILACFFFVNLRKSMPKLSELGLAKISESLAT